jgi:hypothetical protein
MFDVDKDGKISYNDFHKSVGSEIHPGEGLYFRQDKPQNIHSKKCKQYQCWENTCGNANYCLIHNKMHNDEVEAFYKRIYNKSSSKKWLEFIQNTRKICKPEDDFQIIELKKF